MEDVTLRPISAADNESLAIIIRETLVEFKANHPGTVYYDEALWHLYELFTNTIGTVYFVAELNNTIVGGCGIFPTEGLPAGTGELVKFYLSHAARGKGIGAALLKRSLAAAKDLGYTRLYLETMPELTIAIPMYEKYGFRYLSQPLGNSGHHGCQIWMALDL